MIFSTIKSAIFAGSSRKRGLKAFELVNIVIAIHQIGQGLVNQKPA